MEHRVNNLIEVGLSLGSNLGDRVATLSHAKRCIAALDGVKVVSASSLYETEPVGVKPEFQHMKFINAVLILKTTQPVEKLHEHLSDIEHELGRVRTEDRFGPRSLDIDVLYAGELVSDQPQLTLPHPRWAQRRFVLQPLAEVRGDLVLPGTTHTVRELLAALPPGEEVRIFHASW
jgi:2-amino-4-hydroxy-6-hydroxymethyldihydropteridine diphosphokinase